MMRWSFSAARRRTLFTLFALAATAGPLSGQTRLGTFAPAQLPPASGGSNPGADPRITMGQVFQAPTQPGALTSLSYWFWTIPGLYDGGGSAQLSLYTFSGTSPVGTPLFQSNFMIPTNSTALELTRYSWSPGISLIPGDFYIALLGGNNPIELTAVLNDIPNSADNTTRGLAWMCDALTGSCDLAGEAAGVPVVHTFEATFGTSVVPEPGSLALLASGIVGMLGVMNRQRRRASQVHGPDRAATTDVARIDTPLA